MSFEIASAYVRVRPNMTGFKSETESGVKSAFSGLAKVVGIALGAGAAFEFGKGAVEAAAHIQKQVETVHSEFGKAGQGLLKFADTTGVALGSVNSSTDATSAKLGSLFRGMGIGQKVAATMTQNWEKLALAFNASSGGGSQGAAAILQQLQTAAVSGSARGLRNLGLQFNTAQIQAAAFKLGLTQTISQALTPGQKAVAAYSLAVAHLPAYLAAARAHSGDLANVQARLSAEWNKAKEALGKALLPAVKKAATELANWLQKLEKSGRLQKDFNEVARVAASVIRGVVGAVKLGAHIWDVFTTAVGGTKHAVELLLIAMAVSKFAAIAGEVVRLATIFGGPLIKAIEAARLVYQAATAAMAGETLGLAIVIRSALITTGIGALVVAIGLAVAYIVTHWSQVKRYTVALADAVIATWQGLKVTLLGIAELLGGQLATFLTLPLRGFLEVASKVTGWLSFLPGVSGLHSKVQDALKYLKEGTTGLVTKGAHNVASGVTQIFNDASKAWSAALQKNTNDPTSRDAARRAGKNIGASMGQGAVDGLAGSAPAMQKTLTDTLQNAVLAARQRIQSTISEAKNNLDKIGSDLAKTIAQIQAKIGGAAGALAGSPQGQAFAKLKKLIESGAPSFAIQRAQQELSSQLQNVGKTQAQNLQTELANLTASFNKGEIGYKTFEGRLHKILSENGVSLQAALKTGGPAFADAFKSQVSALGQQAKAIAAIPAKYRGIGGAGGAADLKIVRPLEVIRNEQLRIAVIAQKQRAAQLKATEKQTAVLEQMKSARIGPVPGHGKTPRGHASRSARRSAGAGTRP